MPHPDSRPDSERDRDPEQSLGDPEQGLGDAEQALKRVIAALSTSADDALSKAVCEGIPDRIAVVDWVERCKRLILLQRDRSALRSEVPALVERLLPLLQDVCSRSGLSAQQVALDLVDQLPAIRALLAEDVEAAFESDPAAKSFAEIVGSYPSIRAIAIYRIAHSLHRLAVPILPRMMTEHAHDRTGIDIHPGARIGRRFFIDHGTGVVIGETTEIGDNVRLYQGVTLGARSPRHGETLRGLKRHPSIEDDVTIYAGATILGGDVTIGRESVIGGNVFLLDSVPPGSRVVGEPPSYLVRRKGSDGKHGPRQLHWDI